MGWHEHGQLINKAGKGKYCNSQSLENLIRYVIRDREEEDRKGELIVWDVLGCPKMLGTESIIEGFRLIQGAYKRDGDFGRYVDHEIYEFSENELYEMKKSGADLKKIAMALAKNIYDENYQVVFGVHDKDKESQNVHVHFVINSVNFTTAEKRHENMKNTKKRELEMQKIIEREIQHSRTT